MLLQLWTLFDDDDDGNHDHDQDAFKVTELKLARKQNKTKQNR